MRAQRIRVGESRVEMQIVKWTAEEYSATWRHTSVAGNMMVFRKVHGSCREARWHRE